MREAAPRDWSTGLLFESRCGREDNIEGWASIMRGKGKSSQKPLKRPTQLNANGTIIFREF